MEEIFETAAEKAGWNDQSKIAILLEYISNQQSEEAFKDFLSEKVSDENEIGQ